MLYFVSAELALGYWLFAFLSTLGALQWVATRYRLGGLAFLGGSMNRARGYVLAVLLVGGGAAGFFISQWQAIFAPGPAGSELAVLFATSAISALVVTIILAALLLRWRTDPSPEAGGHTVTMGHATGQLYLPAGAAKSSPAVCLLPACPVGVEQIQAAELTSTATAANPADAPTTTGQSTGSAEGGVSLRGQPALTAEARSMAILARHLAEEGVVALVVNPDEHSYAYPGMLATLPAAVAVLRERPDVDPNRIGALGEDLGADLVIRASSTSKEIKAVIALAPILKCVPPGLGLLSEMSYFRAMRWARDRRRATLCKELHALDYAVRISPRPFLLLFGGEDRLSGDAPVADGKSISLGSARDSTSPSVGRETDLPASQLQVIPGLGHLNLAAQPQVMRVVSQWLKEHL